MVEGAGVEAKVLVERGEEEIPFVFGRSRFSRHGVGGKCCVIALSGSRSGGGGVSYVRWWNKALDNLFAVPQIPANFRIDWDRNRTSESLHKISMDPVQVHPNFPHLAPQTHPNPPLNNSQQ